MFEFKSLLEEIIEDNDLEMLAPSKDYTHDQQVYMEAYNQALKDIHSEFEEYYQEFMKKYHSFSLN